ncbi:MAG: efflux RND transporter periplasmic adaptor subunit [Hyphomonadaceae bacterium]|nr:efflux RND transporter periplasmic adaptor subunit [Hyphomonadaceae bacterium]
MSRILAIALPILILLLLGGGGFAALQAFKPVPEETDEVPAGLAVFAEPIIEGRFTLTVDAQGEVAPKREIIVSPQIGGRVASLSPDFIDGGFIREGQVLVRLESEDYELAVTRARSSVASAEQALAREQAEAELALQDLEDLGITDASPLARREPQLAQARAALDSAKAQLAEAELNLRRTAVRAPFTGRVRERDVDIGQYASPGQSLGSIFSTDIVEVSLPISDAELGRIGLPLAFAASEENPGPTVTFTARVAGQMREWNGQVTRTAASIDPRSRQLDVIAELIDPYGEGADNGAPMAPGLFVNASIQGATLENVMIVPRSALRGENEIYIGNPKEGTLSIRQVDVVYSSDEGAYLTRGVAAGELAVVSPIQAAFDGMRIKVLERQPDGSIISHEPETDDDGEAVAEASGESNAEGAVQ